jgi:uncharacterized protein YjbI with pentapeptide repeats
MPDLGPAPPVVTGEPRGRVDLDGCRVERASAVGAVLRDAALVDCELASGNFAGVRAERIRLRRVLVHGARLTGAQVRDAALSDVLVRDCRADLATLVGATLERVRFEDCDLREADLSGLRADGLVLERCDLGGAILTGARLRRTELRGCALEAIVGVEALRGVRMPVADVVGSAVTFAHALGIEVVEG